jgi:hypothetical protein
MTALATNTTDPRNTIPIHAPCQSTSHTEDFGQETGTQEISSGLRFLSSYRIDSIPKRFYQIKLQIPIFLMLRSVGPGGST